MALILEVRNERGAVSWHRLDRLPMTLGRAVSNDVIVDDAYVDAVHARISLDENGAPVIADAGSVNGLRRGNALLDGPLALAAGTELLMGRTTLRLRDTDESLAPAVREQAPAALGLADRNVESRFTAALHRRKVQLGLLGALAVALGARIWLGNTEQSGGNSVFAGLLAAYVALLVWATIWAAMSRGPDRKFHLLAQMSVGAAAGLVMIGYAILDGWLNFLFPDTDLIPVVFLAVMLFMTAAVVAAHLAVPAVLSRRARWRAGIWTAGTLLVLLGVGALVSEEEFSDVPKFDAHLRSLPASLVPTRRVSDLVADMEDVKADADEKADETADDEPPAAAPAAP